MAEPGARRQVAAGVAAEEARMEQVLSRGWCHHAHAPLYIYFVVIHTTQTGRPQNDSTVHGYRPLAIERNLIFMHAALFHSGISVCTDILCVSEMYRVERP